MSLLTAAQIARMQTTQNSDLPDICTVSRYTSVSDGAGGTTDSWDSVGAFACRLGVAGNSIGARDAAVAGELQVVADFTITLPVGTSVGNKDRIAISARTFEVVKSLVHSLSTAVRVAVKEIT